MRAIVSVLAVSMMGSIAAAEDRRANSAPSPKETFGEGDKPYIVSVGESRFSTPYGYKRDGNADRKYPLVVIGKWGEGKRYFTPEVRRKHPSFYLEFQASREADGARLADIVTAAVEQGLRIDTGRILYTGFSAGGSGSFKLVRGMASKGMHFAGINRIAGQSESVLERSAVPRTALWLHIGLKDVPKRVEVSRELYRNLKNDPENAGAVETHTSDTVTDPQDAEKTAARNTWVLTKSGVEIARYSEYPECAHEAWIGYADPYMFTWIFGRAIR